MENNKQIKSELGHIYGSRLSKNGNWLNLTIATIINGEQYRIVCPVRIAEADANAEKPYAVIEYAVDGSGNRYIDKARIANIRVYEDRKPKAEQGDIMEDLPF